MTGRTIILSPQGPFTDISAVGLSADGKSVIGSYGGGSSNGYYAFLWTEAGGYVAITPLPGTNMMARGISANGSAVAGTATDTSGFSQGFYWSSATNTVGIGYLSAGDESYANGISGDGTTVIGYANATFGGNDTHAVIWQTSTQHLQNIDTLYSNSSADLVSSDGSVVAGSGWLSTSDIRAFRWTAATDMVDIGGLGGNATYLSAMNDNGDVLVGVSQNLNNESHAFRYVASGSSGTMTDLGTLAGGTYSYARDVNNDGSVVVGNARDASNVNHGFRWTEATGMQTVEEWLASQGANLGDVTTRTADFVSADGNVVMGSAADTTAYIARIGSGIIDPEKFLQTVSATSNIAVNHGIYGADTIMFGAQGEPMRNLLSTGQSSVWGTIDAGYDDSDVSDGGLGLGEFGFGYGIADGVTARFAAGGTYTKQDLDAGGDVRLRGFYLSPEASANVGGDVYLTVGGYFGRGKVDSHRGYSNGGITDFSDGSSNAQTWGAKIRLDWLNAVTIEDTAITPYAALSYARTKVDAFTETDGSFPVSYDASRDHATIARIGTDFVRPLTDNVRLLAKAEADYQFEDRSTSTTGTIVGISGFDLSGQDLQQFWVRGGIGAEFDVAKGSTASFMVNATTQGQDPNIWVRSNFSVKF